MIGDRDYQTFLNTRNELYRERDMKSHPPSRAEAIRLMSHHPNLIKRPILESDGNMAVGFNEDQYRRLATSRRKLPS